MLKIIRNTIRSYLIACGIALNGIAINFLITKAPPANELVMPTTKEFMQIFAYGKRFTVVIISLVKKSPDGSRVLMKKGGFS